MIAEIVPKTVLPAYSNGGASEHWKRCPVIARVPVGANLNSRGIRLCQSVACSYACATSKPRSSAKGAPDTCKLIGKPERLNAHGIEIAGRPIYS